MIKFASIEDALCLCVFCIRVYLLGKGLDLNLLIL